MDGVISVGSWEHECCGAAVERNEVHGRVEGLRVVRDDGSQQHGAVPLPRPALHVVAGS